MNYGKRLLDMFTFSGSVIDSSNGQGTNCTGICRQRELLSQYQGLADCPGVFSYAQNVQSILVTYTTSYYNYSANLHRRLPGGLQWTAAFNGTHSGLTNYQGTSSRSEGYSTSLGSRRFNLIGNYTQVDGHFAAGSDRIRAGFRNPGCD